MDRVRFLSLSFGAQTGARRPRGDPRGAAAGDAEAGGRGDADASRADRGHPGAGPRDPRRAFRGARLALSVARPRSAAGTGEDAMELPENGFKRALAEGRPQIGFWCTLPGGYGGRAAGGRRLRLAALRHRAFAGRPDHRAAAAAGRGGLRGRPAWCAPAWNDAVLIKRFLDIGAQIAAGPLRAVGRGGARRRWRRSAIRRAGCAG